MIRFLGSIIFLSVLFLSGQAFAKEETKTFSVAYIKDFYPYQFQNEGEPQGFVIDILNQVSSEEEIALTYVPMILSDALKALEDGRVDAIAGLNYTAERSRNFEFSKTLATVSQTLLVESNDLTINSIADLGEKVVAIERGSTSLENLQDIRNVEVILANSQEDAIKLFEIGRADAFLGNNIVIERYIEKNKMKRRFRIADDLIYPGEYAFAVSKDEIDLLNLINRGLIKVRAQQIYQDIYNEWFEVNNSLLMDRLKGTIQILVVILLLVGLYSIMAMRWNNLLKQKVTQRTEELKKVNDILKEKIEEEKRIRLQLVHKEKMESLGQLVAGIAHELRNPLTSIKAFVDLIPSKFDNKKFRGEISTYVPSEINRLNNIVKSLLDYAKPQDPIKEKFSLDQCLTSVITLMELQFKKKRIMINYIKTENMYVYADYGQIKQVLINVLLNAMDAIDEHGTINIKTRQEDEMIHLSIEDNGIGIEPEQLKNIFEPFYTTKKSGTGLGLSLSLQYMKENDGDLKIESDKVKGTKATLILPKGGKKGE